ncbi:Hypothetical protein NTJ_11403 [Nesidiocoris tenuis]|uniref:Ig-like domain-containing protein n=1 Tax=Nesidiocoris tenuis TaxID=355587 RepID=A0ABN7B2V8_9HEMI|nr:Hypothetical protein NTJ_11403 [Nesidiocoris tenuis]
MLLFHSLILSILLTFGFAVRVRIMVPKSARAHSAVTLVCQYDLDGKPLYAVKWYRGNHEFFRYVPQESPSMVAFPVPGLVVDFPGSNAHQVTLLDVPVNISGLVSCEVSADLTFSTASDSANLTVFDPGLRKPSLHLSSSVLKANSDLQVNCSAQLTDPPATISFYIDNEKVDQQWIRELEPGLVSLSLSALKDPSPDVSSPENKSKLQQLNHKQYKHYKPVWIRCEAYVKGRYLMSSPSVPIIPDFHSDRPHEDELGRSSQTSIIIFWPIFAFWTAALFC